MPARPDTAGDRRRITRPARVRAAVSIALVAAATLLLIVGSLLPTVDGGGVPVLSWLDDVRALFLVGVVGVALVVLIVVLVLRWRWTAIAAAATVLVLSLVIAVPAALRSPGSDPAGVSALSAGTLRVLEWDTDRHRVGVSAIETLITQTDPNVVVLPEYSVGVAGRSLSAIATERDMQVLGRTGSSATVLVSRALGEYQVDRSGVPLGAGFVAVPSHATSPRLVIVDLQPPGSAGSTTWRTGIAWAARECLDDTLAIGDFGATDRTISPGRTLGSCADSARAAGVSPGGTWPTVLPAAVGAAVDHVFAGPVWRPIAFSVLDGVDQAGSRHRPTFAVLATRS